MAGPTARAFCVCKTQLWAPVHTLHGRPICLRMQSFAALLERLVLTPSRNAKLQLITDYLRHTPDPSRGWAIAAITGDLDIASVKPAALRELVADRIDPVLFALSYDYVGDLAETISLIWPQRPGANRAPALNEIVETLMESTKAQGLLLVEGWLDALDSTGRWALLKLVTGGLRIGVSARLARQALADFGKVDVAEIEELWHGLSPPYLDLLAWLEGRAPKPVASALAPFRPPMLAHPLLDKSERIADADIDPDLISPADFAAEWKWDGVRVQLVADQGVRRLYTRNGDDISKAFPDLLEAADFNAALDGELLIRSPIGGVASFNELQQRLNRKTVTPKQMAERPAMLRAYDILQESGEDLRALPFAERRKRLERFVVTLNTPRIDLSPLVRFEDAIALRRPPPQSAHARDRRPDAEALGRALRRRPPRRPVVQVEARPAPDRRRADVRPARPRQTLRPLFRFHLRRLAHAQDERRRRRTHARRQGLFRLHRR